MRISERDLRRQFDQVRAAGWWDHLQEAARAVFPAGEFDAVDLFAIGSRESNWNPRYLEVPGDHGNGFGPLQIDKRSFPEWISSGAWRDPRQAIRKGAEVLRQKLDDTRALQGRSFQVRTLSGRTYTCPRGKDLSPDELRRVAIAAFNSGRWAHYHVSKGRSPDHGTTGKDYSADVLARAATARPWAPAPPATATAEKTGPTCNGAGTVPAC